MELSEAIQGRRSVRTFTGAPVAKDILENILATALWAPSGMNTQNWHFVVVGGKKADEIRNISREAFETHTLANLQVVFAERPEIVEANRRFSADLGAAPVVICAYRIPTLEGDRTDIQSVAAAIQNLLLLIHQEGLGACWMTGPVYLAEKINQVTGVDDKTLQAIIPVGHPQGSFPIPKRREGKIAWIGWD